MGIEARKRFRVKSFKTFFYYLLFMLFIKSEKLQIFFKPCNSYLCKRFNDFNELNDSIK